MGSNSESDTRIKQRDNGDTFCYCKVERATTLWGAIEKVEILPLQHWKINYLICALFFFILGAPIIFVPKVVYNVKRRKR